MLATGVFIDSPLSSGGGIYTLDLYFSQLSAAKFLNVGDYIKDTANNEYEITLLANNPHIDGSQATVQFITTDTLPIADVDYDSIAFTPGQQDVRPSGRTEINIDNSVVFDPQNYEYTLDITVDSLQQADQMVVGDAIVDGSGKEYNLTFIDLTNRFTVSCRVSEEHAEGVIPSLGIGTMYQATANVNLFRGTPISDPARTVTRNRDNFVVDAKFQEIEDLIAGLPVGGGDDTKTFRSLKNTSGITIPAFTAVRPEGSGIAAVNVSTEGHAMSTLGISTAEILNAADGVIVTSGVILDITTTADVSDELYVAAGGGITATKPSIGVGGFGAEDFVIKLGTIVANQANASLKDLEVKIELVGQL